MSRDELNASQLAELAALERILARDPVDEEHLELAALVDSVRAGAPRMERDFQARLDTKLSGLSDRRRLLARPRVRRLALPRPGMRRLAVGSGSLLAAAVALAIVISSGLLGGGSAAPKPASRGPVSAFGQGVAPAGKGAGAPSPSTGTSLPGASTNPSASSSVPATNAQSPSRLVQRASTLTLASAPATMQGVANQIVAATERQGGVVASSDVNIQGPSSYADFSLQVPGGRLGALIATLSALASVRTLTQSTHDITDGYNRETARLADSVAERAVLLKKLAAAATAADATAFQRQLDALAHRIAAEHRAIDTLLNQGHTATLQVNVVAGAAGVKHSIAAGPLSKAFHTALHALEEILAIALIAFAIILPFALSALVLWWAAATLRQRGRERAMRTA